MTKLTEAKEKPPLKMAESHVIWRSKNEYYYNHIKRLIRETIPAGKRVVDVGCGTGELLASARPSQGLGIDKDQKVIEWSRKKYPHLEFRTEEIESTRVQEKFPYVLMIDFLDRLDDMWDGLIGTENLVEQGTLVLITTLNPLWQPIFNLAQAIRLKMPEPPHNFVRMADIVNLLEILDYSVVKKEMRFLVPFKIPLFSEWLNKIVPRIPVLRKLCALQLIVARKEATSREHVYCCSVVVPCYNEEGNVRRCAETIPQMGKGTEVIFVNDGSVDGTERELAKLAQDFPHVRVISYAPNQGKGNAVRKGFEHATGDILMIFDADLTVPGRDLHKFYYPLAHHKARFINGSRLVYPLEKQAMRTANLWGNQFFGMVVSWLINQRVTDTLCGTKAFFKEDYLKMNLQMDRWGDFDYLFSTKQLGLKLVEIPIHYKRREAGESKMRAFRHGLLLTKVCLWGVLHIQLKPFLKKIFRKY